MNQPDYEQPGYDPYGVYQQPSMILPAPSYSPGAYSSSSSNQFSPSAMGSSGAPYPYQPLNRMLRPLATLDDVNEVGNIYLAHTNITLLYQCQLSYAMSLLGFGRLPRFLTRRWDSNACGCCLTARRGIRLLWRRICLSELSSM